jgi:signal transduction histidine kinase
MMLRESKEKFSRSFYAGPVSTTISTVEDGRLMEANRALELKLTEREAAILRLSRLYAVLSVTNHTIVRANDRDTLFSNICRGAVEQGGFLLVWTGLIDDESGMVKPVAWHGANNGFLDNIRISVKEEPEGLGPTGSAIRDGSYHICNDFNDDPRTLLWHEKGREHGINSSASIALTLNKKVIGALTIYSDEPNFFCDQMIGLLKQMAMDISFALDNLDHAARHLEAERALHAETMERLRAVEALRKKEQQFMQQSRHAAMGEMIGNIAHQWRQPLNSLGLIIQQLQVCYKEGEFFKEHLDKSAGKTMDIIQHMSRTIGDFIDFFRPDKERVTFNVTKEISKSLSLIEAAFNDQRISIEVNPTGDPVIYGHPNEFSQVLLNIMINAKDAFEDRKTDSPKVTINLFTEDDRSVVSITDNAGGIPEDIMDNIFDPYFTTKGPDKGTGVGLFMSRIIIEKNMAGSLVARNTGNGAEFRIEV